MLDLAAVRDTDVWDRFRPVGEGIDDPESFAPWWERHSAELNHLHVEICEQWIYRHWRGTRHRWLDPLQLSWREEWFSADELLCSVHLHWGAPADPECDYEVFRPDVPNAQPTALPENWNGGTWTIAPVLLETPLGVRFLAEEHPEIRYLVVEGSKRYRWLNALVHRGQQTGPHRAYVLSPRVQDVPE
jgi:hypothetical protein